MGAGVGKLERRYVGTIVGVMEGREVGDSVGSKVGDRVGQVVEGGAVGLPEGMIDREDVGTADKKK